MATFRWPNWWDPFSTLRTMQREFERLAGRGAFGGPQRIGGGVFPAVNILNSNDEILVQAEVPGVGNDDIDLSITGETLVIKGAKRGPDEEDKMRYERRERGVGDFSRTIVLPDRVESDKVEAELAHGILSIRLPKSESAKPRQIPVK